MSDEDDAVFRALAHAKRRKILDLVREKPGIRIGALAASFEFSRIAVHKHVGVLEAAGLIISERQGRVRRLYLNMVPIQKIYERWTDVYGAAWTASLTRFARNVEQRAGHRNGKRKSGF